MGRNLASDSFPLSSRYCNTAQETSSTSFCFGLAQIGKQKFAVDVFSILQFIIRYQQILECIHIVRLHIYVNSSLIRGKNLKDIE